MEPFDLPVIFDYGTFLLVFGGALLVFHITLVATWPLGKVGWKCVDYLWLSCALVGLLAALGSARQFAAQSLLIAAEQRVSYHASELLDRLRFGASDAVCRTAVRSTLSPPPETFERIQLGYDAVCSWSKGALETAPGWLAARQQLGIDALGVLPIAPDVPDWIVASVIEQLNLFNSALIAHAKLESASRRSSGEEFFVLFGPYLIGIALALRVSKVSAEIYADLTTGVVVPGKAVPSLTSEIDRSVDAEQGGASLHPPKIES